MISFNVSRNDYNDGMNDQKHRGVRAAYLGRGEALRRKGPVGEAGLAGDGRSRKHSEDESGQVPLDFFKYTPEPPRPG